MPISRFDQLIPNDYSFQVYSPQEYVPDLGMLDSLLGGLQQEYDTGKSALSRIMPNYLRNSETDVEAARGFRSKYDQLIKESSDAFSKGNISEGRRVMMDALREVEKDKLPGGDYYELERRVGEYQNEYKRLRDTYKDNPRLADYLANTKIGITPFRDPTTGEPGSIKPAADIYKDVPEKDISAWFNQTLDNIKDTLIQQGWSKHQVDEISTIHDLKTLTGRQFNDVMSILTRTFPEEFKQSIAQRYAADRYYNPNLPDIDPTQIFEVDTDKNGARALRTDKEGRPVFANTPLGNMIQGYALAGTRVKPEDRIVKDDNEILLANVNHNLRKKEIDYEFNLGNVTSRTPVFTKGSGMPELDLGFDSKGKVTTGKGADSGYLSGLASTGMLGPGTSGKTTLENTNQSFKEFIKSDKAKREYPELVKLNDRFKDYVSGLSDDKALKFLSDKYNEKREALQTADAQYTEYNSPKVIAARRLSLIGSTEGKEGARIGNIANKTILVHGADGEPVAYKFQDFMKKYGISDREFVERTFINGMIRSDNSLVPSGEELRYSRPDGSGITFVATDISQEDAAFKSPEYLLHQARANGSVDRTKSTYTGIPELDARYGRIYAVGYDERESDMVARQMDDLSLPHEETQALADRFAYLKEHPNEDRYIRRDADLYSSKTGKNLTKDKNEQLTIDKIATLKSILLNGQ